MRLKYLGDALDHWKGSLLGRLQSAGRLQDLHVETMAMDRQRWSDADISLFAQLLHVTPGAVLPHCATLRRRLPYFAEITHRGDLFLDPDTGVLTGRPSGQPEQYLMPSDVKVLLDANPNRVLAIYQHIRAQAPRGRLTVVVRAIRSLAKAATFCSYESAAVAMLFTSNSRERIDGIAEHLTSFLGRHASKRVGRWRGRSVRPSRS